MAGKVLIPSHGRIAVDPACVPTDLAELQATLGDGRIGAACELLAAVGDRRLLEHIDPGAPFEQWLTARRTRDEQRLLTAVDRALAAIDDPAIRAELAPAWRNCGRAPVRDDKARTAILPFARHGTVGGDVFLAEGVVEELTFRLAGVAGLALVGRTSVASVVTRGETLPAIATTLGVSYLIEGDVYRSPEGIRVTIRLIDGNTGTGIWSDRYDRTVAGAIGSRDAIGSQFARGLCAALGIAAPPVPARRMTTDRDAYALYLQGRALTMKTIDRLLVQPRKVGRMLPIADGSTAAARIFDSEYIRRKGGRSLGLSRRERAGRAGDDRRQGSGQFQPEHQCVRRQRRSLRHQGGGGRQRRYRRVLLEPRRQHPGLGTRRRISRQRGLGIVTTDRTGTAGSNQRGDTAGAYDYTNDFLGTSAATPIVSGVATLMLDANPDLGWRDVQNILALSATRTGSGYGAMRMAEAWSLFAPAQTSANERSVVVTTAPNLAMNGSASALTTTTARSPSRRTCRSRTSS